MTMMMITFESLWFIFSVDFCIYCIQYCICSIYVCIMTIVLAILNTITTSSLVVVVAAVVVSVDIIPDYLDHQVIESIPPLIVWSGVNISMTPSYPVYNLCLRAGRHKLPIYQRSKIEVNKKIECKKSEGRQEGKEERSRQWK